MFGRSWADEVETVISKAHFSTVVRAQMTAYCQRHIEAKLVHDESNNSHLQEVFFVLKQIMLCMDQSEWTKTLHMFLV